MMNLALCLTLALSAGAATPDTPIHRLNHIELLAAHDLVLERADDPPPPGSESWTKFRAYFQGGAQVTLAAVRQDADRCELALSREGRSTAPSRLLLPAGRHRDALFHRAGLSARNGSFTTHAYFSTGDKDLGNLICTSASAPVRPRDLDRITGGAVTVTQTPIPKGGRSEAELQAEWDRLRGLFQAGEIPSDEQLRLGRAWDCETFALDSASLDDPLELAYAPPEPERPFRRVTPDDRVPGDNGELVTNGSYVYTRFREGLIALSAPTALAWRANGALLIREVSTSAQATYVPRLAEHPDAALIPGYKASSYAVCR